MITEHTRNSPLFTLFRKIALAPNDRAIHQAFSAFHTQFKEIEALAFTPEMTHCFFLARERLKRMEDAPLPLKSLISRIESKVQEKLRIHPVLLSHLSHDFWDQTFDSSLINDYLKIPGVDCTYSDLFFLLGSDWGGYIGSGTDCAQFDMEHVIITFCNVIHYAVAMRIGTQASVWEYHELDKKILDLIIEKKEEPHQRSSPSEPDLISLENLKKKGAVYYYPIGYANLHVFFYHILAIDHVGEGFRLRLLTSNNSNILACGNKANHFCPEVVWENLQASELSEKGLWEVLFEPGTLSDRETMMPERDNDAFLAFTSNHIVSWLTKKLGKAPKARLVGTEEQQWKFAFENKYRSVNYTADDNVYCDVPKEANPRVLLLSPTEKEMKRSYRNSTLFKYVNLIPLDVLKDHRTRLLFKAESRLMLLAQAYKTLMQGTCTPNVRGLLLRLFEDSWGKVTDPIARLMKLHPSSQQNQEAQTLLISLLDLKHRLKLLLDNVDKKTLTVSTSHYGSTHQATQLKLGGISFSPVKPVVLETVRLFDNVPALPGFQVMNRDNCALLHRSLEEWYDVLLDAKNKCEPVEILLLAHRNVFSRLPIPLTGEVEKMFPEPTSEGLQVGILILLKKISSLVASEVYSDNFVPPIFVVDMTCVYRFALELFRHIDVKVRTMPVSWFCLHEYMQSKNSFHLPGDVLKTLDLLVVSFKAISPQGHLKPSDSFQEIPLFYFSWDLFPHSYTFHRKSLGPLRWSTTTSFEEILQKAEQADSVGLKPEETVDGIYRNCVKWENSFGGQCLMMMEEIAQYYTMATFAKAKTHQQALQKKDFVIYQVNQQLGPEDHFKLPVIRQSELTEWSNSFGGYHIKYGKQVVKGETPMEHRMSVFHDSHIKETIDHLPVKYAHQFRSQAELIKALPKYTPLKGLYYLHQASSGPSTLSIDVLLEYFEGRSALLLNRDYRSYFMAIIRSAHILETAVREEPLLLKRLKRLIAQLSNEDQQNLQKSTLHFERLLWLSALTRHLCRLGHNETAGFADLLGNILKSLRHFALHQAFEYKLAPHLLASQGVLNEVDRLSIVELARHHLLVGFNPPSEANDLSLWIEAAEAMQREAYSIQQALLKGDVGTRCEIWTLILKSPEDVQQALRRKTQNLSFETLSKTSVQLDKLKLKQTYLQNWSDYHKKYPWQENTWRHEATELALKHINNTLFDISKRLHQDSASLFNRVEEVFVCSGTALLINIKGRLITVDWMTGRIMGNALSASSGKRLPIFLRKHADLSLLDPLLRTPLASNPDEKWMHFEAAPAVFIDLLDGAAWLKHEDSFFRLLSQAQTHSLDLPEQLTDRMSVWFKESGEKREGIIAAHDKKGIPHPIYSIDSEGRIHSLKGNTHLQLATKGYYPEAQLFFRWGIDQKHILVWLDEERNVSELHIPFDNGEKTFTRVIKQGEGKWWIEGLDVFIVPIEETIESFAGHPVYLVVQNVHQQRLMLLPGATPYELSTRLEKNKHEVSWSRIHTSGPEEKIHQFRILQGGKVQGLTVADNLLLMLWKIKTGDYASASELAQRWIAPPGRPYTKTEEKILASWFKTTCGNTPMQAESHPSVLAIRLYVMIRVVRHLKRYPPPGKKGKALSKFAEKIIGSDSYPARNDMESNIMNRQLFEKQVRGTLYRDLINLYDHEACIRYMREHYVNDSKPFIRMLYQRSGTGREEQIEGTTLLELRFNDREIIDYNISEMNEYSFQELIREFPSKAQTSVVPVKSLYRKVISTPLINFFDKAYTLIKSGPRNDAEREEYEAVIHGIKSFREESGQDLVIDYYHVHERVTCPTLYKNNIILWLLLEQAYHAKSSQKPLPELPSIERRFGLALEGSQEQAERFFKHLAEVSGKSVVDLLFEYRKEWYAKRRMRYMTQQSYLTTIPADFLNSLKTTHSTILTEQIQGWKYLKPPLNRHLQSDSGPRFGTWYYPVPNHWKDIPQDDLQPQLKERAQFIHHIKLERQKELLALANQLPVKKSEKLHEFAKQIHYGSPYSIDDCLGMALAGDEKLTLAVLLYLEASLESAHLTRCADELERCKDPEQLKQVREVLFTPHLYLPSVETLPLMISEYYTDCRLRTQPNQVMLIEQLTLESKNKGSVIQAIMGSGKSKMIAPMWLRIMLSRGRIPFLCVPSSLFQTTLSDLQEMMWTRFRTHVRAFTFDREHCNLETLHSLAESLYVGRIEPTVFVCSTRDLHALQLMLKERHQVINDMRDRLKSFTLVWAKTRLSPAIYLSFEAELNKNQWNLAKKLIHDKFESEYNRWLDSHLKLEKELQSLIQEADILQAILNLLQNELALLVDEVATSWDPKNLLSFPIGWQIQANQHAVSVGCKLYFEWLVPYYQELNLMSNMQSFTKGAVRQKIISEIATRAWNEYRTILPDLPSLSEFSAYLQSDCETGGKMEAYISRLHTHELLLLRQYAQEIAYLKYCLTSGLDGALTSSAHINYGRSKQDPELYLAIPYQYANVPKENTLFRKPWKTILMTCQLYAQGWTDFKQTAELIGFLQGIDPNSKDVRILDAASKVWGRRFSDANLVDDEEMQQLTEVLDRARLNEQAEWARLLISTYLKCCVFSNQLKLDPSQMTSSPQDIPMIAEKTDAMGGTFGFETTWHPQIVRVYDKSSDETIEKALREPRNQTCLSVPKGGVEGLFSLLTGKLKGYLALIDCGALFKGFSNEKVAQRLYSIGKDSGFDSILFYHEEKVGDVRLAVMTRNGKVLLESSDKEGVRRAFNQLKLSRPFIFFDHARRIGADLDIKPGRALVTFSDQVTIDDLFQGAMRCRGLIDGRHSIDYAVPSEMEGNWNGNEVIRVAKIQQQQVETNSNFHGICDQMRGALRTFIDKAMRSQPDFEQRHQIHMQAQVFLMEEQVNDLVKAFGSLQEMVNAQAALLHLKDALIKTADKCIPGHTGEVTRVLDDILKWHVKRGTKLPELIRLGESQDDAVQEVDISKLQENMRQKEEEYERMLGTRNPKQEIEWTVFDVDQIKPSPIGYPPEGPHMPTLYSLKDALAERGFKLPISDELLVSANLLSTFIGEGNCLLTPNQKPLHRLLFVAGRHGNSKIVLVSEGDASHLKNHLVNLSGQEGKGIYLMEPNGMINQRGCRKEKVWNLWIEGTVHIRHLLLQLLCFQGSALCIDQLPEEEVRNAFDLWSKKDPNRLSSIRILFESVLDMKTEEMIYYRRSKKLRAYFNHVKEKQ